MALIYCVEDDENIRELVGYALRSQDFEVETFADGKEFWKAVQQRVPALVLLDIMLPGESGTEILDKIRKDTQPVSYTHLSRPRVIRSQYGRLAACFD